MVRRENADEAVKDPNPTIDGRRANVNLAYIGAKNRTTSLPRMFISRNTSSDRLSVCLFVCTYAFSFFRMQLATVYSLACPRINRRRLPIRT